ncbi:MAG: SH3 domain-containing protein [Spirochaetes bacterium]|nr:SH3 domain-containing protein [Spirochaetota bacterium]
MKRLAIIFLGLSFFTCRTAPRSLTPLEEVTAPHKPPIFRYIAPKNGITVVNDPLEESTPIARLPQNTKVRVIEEKEIQSQTNIKKLWTHIAFDKNGIPLTGWVASELLSTQEIIVSKEKIETTSFYLDKSQGPIVPVRGHFILAECIYSSSFGSTPYHFLGSQKQSFIFHEDSSCTFEINNCTGITIEEGNFVQHERIIRVKMAETTIILELINPSTLKITEGSDFLTCQVCREAYLSRKVE